MSARALLNTSLKSWYLAGTLLMSTRVVSEFVGVVVVTNSLKICTSASLEACANAAAFTQAMLVAGDGGTEVSVTVVTPSQLRYTCYSDNVPGLHIKLQVELLTPFTSGLPFLLCSSFVLTLLIRKRHLVVLSFCSIVLRSQTNLQSETPNSLLCSISGYCACCAP